MTTATASEPNKRSVIIVAKEAAPVSTRRSPIMMVESKRCGFPRRYRAIVARLPPAVASVRSLVSLTEKKPISAAEMTAETRIKLTNIR